MPVKTEFVTADYMRTITLPTHGGRYAVIPHGYLIDQTRAELTAAGFTVNTELYKTTQDGQIAQGVYHLNYGTDKDMGLMFAWSNSYNKSMRFKCAVGAHVFICMNGVVSGGLGNYKRKHTGSAKMDAQESIQGQIATAKEHYDNLVADKEMLKQVSISSKEQGSIVGELFLDKEILTLTQLGIIKRELKNPSYAYEWQMDSAWALYNHITAALKDSHPSYYLRDHEYVHSYFVDRFGSLKSNPAVLDEYFNDEDEEQFEEAELETAGFGVNFL